MGFRPNVRLWFWPLGFGGPKDLIRKAFQFKNTSGNEVSYTNSLILLIKMMLCSKLHCQKFFRLQSFSYKIATHESRDVWQKCQVLQSLDLIKAASLRGRERMPPLPDIRSALEPFFENGSNIPFRRPRCRLSGQPSTLNPQPSTLNPQPSTLNPQPSTLNPQPSTLNPQPSTLNPHPSTLNPQPSTLNPKSSTLN